MECISSGLRLSAALYPQISLLTSRWRCSAIASTYSNSVCVRIKSAAGSFDGFKFIPTKNSRFVKLSIQYNGYSHVAVTKRTSLSARDFTIKPLYTSSFLSYSVAMATLPNTLQVNMPILSSPSGEMKSAVPTYTSSLPDFT